MSPTRLALCSDTHIWPNAQQRFGTLGAQMQPWSREIQAALLAEIAAAQPDLLFHLGDFTCGGGSFGMAADDFQTTLTELVAACRSLPATFYGVPGNHDCPLGQNWRFAEELLGLGPGLGQTIDTPEARLILLNAQGHSQAQIDAALPGDPTIGYVGEAELSRLETALAEADRPVLLFLHQLLRPWEGDQPWAALYGVQNGDAVLDLLARYPVVKAVFQAHAHRLDVQQAQVGGQGCWFVVLPAVIEYPMAWLDLTLRSDAVQVNLRRLPLTELAETSRQSGETGWRAGRPEWNQFAIPLRGA
jgi:3',5'-cyclic AMP phosphodiesterase CpdA